MVSATAAAAVTAEVEIERWREERLQRRPLCREWTRVRDRNRRRVLHFIFYENLAAASIEVRLAL